MAKKSRVRRRKSIKRKSRVRRGRKIIKGGAGGRFLADEIDNGFLIGKFEDVTAYIKKPEAHFTYYKPMSDRLNPSFKISGKDMTYESRDSTGNIESGIAGKVSIVNNITPDTQYNITQIIKTPKENFIVYYDDYEPLGSVDS